MYRKIVFRMRDEINGADARCPEEARPSRTRRTSQGAADEGNAADAPFISSRPLISLAILCLISFAAPLHAKRGGADAAYATAKACVAKLRAKPKAEIDPAQWEKCMGMFEGVARKYTKSPRAPEALFNAGNLRVELLERLHRETDAESAIKTFNQLIKEYPESSLVDDALLKIGKLRFEPLHEDDRARHAFNYIIENYPSGDMVQQAKDELAAIDSAQAKVETLEKPDAKKSADVKAGGIKEGSAAKSSSPFAAPVATARDEAVINRIDLENGEKETVVTFVLSRKASYSLKFTEEGLRTKSPPKLELVLAYTKVSPGISREINVSSKYLGWIKMKKGLLQGGTYVTFEMMPGSTYDISSGSNRFIIRFMRSKGGSPRAALKPAGPAVSKADTKAKSADGRTFVIVIDPGHGGEDTGAIGKGGIREKDVVLAISKKVAARIKNDTGAKVYLTRDTDKTLTLEERDAIAVSKKADIFISIHANASTNRKQAGIETYYLNNASDEAAARLAKRENKSAGKKLSDVEHILSTMLQNYDTAESEFLASDVQKALFEGIGKKYKGVKNRKVRSALFYVLVGAKCPAILVETSFISNPVEEKRLKNADYQKDVAAAVANGVKKYMSPAGKRTVQL